MADTTYTSHLHYDYAQISQILQLYCTAFYIEIQKKEALVHLDNLNIF